MEILFETLTSETFSFEVMDFDTFETVKAKIRDFEAGMCNLNDLAPFPKLVRVKAKTRKICNPDGLVSIHEPVPKGALQILVQNNTAKTIISLPAAPCYTIKQLKGHISPKACMLPFYQILFFAGVELEDHRTIADYNILSASTVHLVARCLGRIRIYVETTSGNKIPLIVSCSNTILQVKALIQDKEGICPDQHQQKLVYAGHVLDDSRNLAYYYIQNGSTLRLVDDASMRGLMLQINVMISTTGNTVFKWIAPAPSRM